MYPLLLFFRRKGNLTAAGVHLSWGVEAVAEVILSFLVGTWLIRFLPTSSL
jgi:hypothetical protein